MPAYVLDGSMTMAWCFSDEATSETEAARQVLRNDTALAPSIWLLETTNVLLVALRRGRISEADAQQSISLLHALPVRIVQFSARQTFDEILSLARTSQLSACDAAYLYLAVARNLPLATLDAALATAAKALGVPLVHGH
ncbi:MAG TPA: type II toxin-antitoxin system VapC family toxin [Rhodothermales bacterium]|nr:type II toxin-antitoxin system VapC family toxin [Rhodothermales bacterium]